MAEAVERKNQGDNGEQEGVLDATKAVVMLCDVIGDNSSDEDLECINIKEDDQVRNIVVISVIR